MSFCVYTRAEKIKEAQIWSLLHAANLFHYIFPYCSIHIFNALSLASFNTFLTFLLSFCGADAMHTKAFRPHHYMYTKITKNISYSFEDVRFQNCGQAVASYSRS